MKYGDNMLKTLSFIGVKLNSADLTWAVGASLLLNLYGLIEKPNDIDLFIDLKDIEKADEILKSMGVKKESHKTAQYSTEFFYEYNINGVEVDVMAGFGVNHSSGNYKYILDCFSVPEIIMIQGVGIPFTALEDWYVLYQLIPGRSAKADLVGNYIISRGSKNPFLLKRALTGCLPEEVRVKIMGLLGKID
jgi:hypothetical protein